MFDCFLHFVLWTIIAALVVTGIIIKICENQLGIVSQFIFKVDTESKHHGGELVAEVLKNHNIKHLFTLVGGHISPVLVAAEKIGIRVIDTRHEATAVFAADAVARLTGSVGVAVLTAGPGVTNAVTAVKNAQMAESPVLIIGGASASILKGRGALQDIDQISLFKSLCKYCYSVKTVREIIPTLRKAMSVAVSDTPGPVFVELPIDVLYPYSLVKREFKVKDNPKGLTQKITNWYLKTYLNNLFVGAWEKTDTSPISPEIPIPSEMSIYRCIELISNSKRPLILFGSQATIPPTPVEELKKATELLGIPCFLGGMARGLLGKDNPLQIRQHRREALNDADLIILAGTVCDFRLSYGRNFNRKCKIIAINRNRSQLLKNSGIFWKPTEAIEADVGSFIIKLSETLKGDYKYDSNWLPLLQNRDKEKELQNKKMAEELPDNHLNPLKILQHVEDNLDDDAILIADGGDFVGSAAYILRPRGPLKWLDPGAFGTLGVGGGFALGAKVCFPESEVWIIYGDGSCGYSVAEIDTFTRHNLPVLSIVGNDAGWTQISREQVPMFGTNVACGLEYCNYHIVAEGFGGKGILLERKDNDSIDKILKKAKALYREGNSVLINAFIGKSKFREGSISV